MRAWFLIPGVVLNLLCACERSQPSAAPESSPIVPESAVAPVSAASPVREDAAVEAAPVAVLMKPVADVKARASGELIWKDGTEGMPLGNRASVKTGPSSSDVIRFNDSTELKMGENSVVVVVDRKKRDGAEESVVSVPSGRVNSSLKPSVDRPVVLEVRTRRGWIRASNANANSSGAAFSVSISERGKLEVKNEGAEVRWVVRGGERKIPSHQTLTVAADGSAPEPLPDGAGNAAVENQELPVVDQAKARISAATPAKAPGTSGAPGGMDFFRIETPKNHSTVLGSTATVRGVLGGSLKAYLNGAEIHSVQGLFTVEVPLIEGANVITIQVIGPGKDDVRYETLEITRGDSRKQQGGP